MSREKAIYDSLVAIVGEDFVSNEPEDLYMYTCDGGTTEPRKVDYVVVPKTVEEVQKIVLLANREKVPITPMGGGLTLNGLVIPVHGGIVMDMKRMDRIIKVNTSSRYVVIEAGVSQGALLSYLRKHHPDFQHSMPEAPSIATVVGNLLIRGHGSLAQCGDNSNMLNGMEVVLPTGEICQVGSCSASPHWFSKGPLPDLTGLFIGWFGTTGIVTKASLRLYPRPEKRDMILFATQNPDLIPDLVYKITQTRMADNIGMMEQEKPEYMKGFQFTGVIISGDSEEEMDYKRKVLGTIPEMCGDSENKVTLLGDIPASSKERFLEEPPFAAVAADFRKGGGFQYCGIMMPVEKVPEAWRKGIEIARRHGMLFQCANQVMSAGHEVMFGFNYSFNRADEEDEKRAKAAMEDTNKMGLELGGIPWKADLQAQRYIVEKMDPNTVELMKKVRKLLDPNGIMNPGNWEN
ncbi:MAG: FAD-binding oxidoreductase [Deltaproteobacteria bacterium]|nr:FAD-binding oxidoreductase [Deltaproteobacteria bacterium]